MCSDDFPITCVVLIAIAACVTTTPVYFCAAIYVTLSSTIQHLSPGLSRFNPKFFYWIFIPCDLCSLTIVRILTLSKSSLSMSREIGDSKPFLNNQASLTLQIYSKQQAAASPPHPKEAVNSASISPSWALASRSSLSAYSAGFSGIIYTVTIIPRRGEWIVG